MNGRLSTNPNKHKIKNKNRAFKKYVRSIVIGNCNLLFCLRRVLQRCVQIQLIENKV